MRATAFFKPAIAAAAATVALTGCISPNLSDFDDAPRQLVLEDYFEGSTTAYGIFEDRFNKVRRSFKVDIEGTIEGDQLTLVEDFIYDDGELDQRIWVIDILGDGKYRGTAGDVPGYAYGETNGNAFNWKYKVDLKVDENSTWKVGFDDWMYLLEDGKLMNRAYVSRWGILIGEVTISFDKNG